MRSVDYRDLEIFAIVAEEGSIRAAALQLNLSQPSVSRRMSRLEQCLELSLLDRSTRGVVLTPAGRLLLPFIDRGRGLLKEMFAALEQSSTATTFEIWTDATLAPLVMSFVCTALADVPAELSNQVASMDKVLAAVEHGPADVAFGASSHCPDTVSAVPFFKDALAYVVHPEHPLAARRDVSLDDLIKHEVALVDWGTSTEHVIAHLQAAGMPPDRLRSVTPGGTAAMLSFYCSHVGVSTRSSLASVIQEGLLVEVFPADLPELEIVVHLMFRTADADREGVRALRHAVAHVWQQGGIPLPRQAVAP